MGDLVERNAVMNSIIAEYNRKGDRGGLKLAWIEKAVNEVPSTLEQEPCDDVCEWFEQYVDIATDIVEIRFSDGTVKRAKRGLYMRDIEKSIRKMLIDQMANEKKQEPCDAVSRKAAIDACLKGLNRKEMVANIKSLPSVTPAEKQEPCEDCVSRDAVLEALYDHEYKKDIRKDIEALPSVQPNKWIPVKWHEITDEEREREGYPKEWVCHLDSIMPYDGQRILITTKGGFVELDECYSDDGCEFSLDSGYDWVDDVIAWMPLPEPYKASPTGAESQESEE